MSLLRFVVPVLAMALSFPAMAAEYVYATQDLEARRWQEAETPTSGAIATNDRLEVVYRGEGWLRVRLSKSPKFGWVAATAVTDVAPAGAELAPTGPGALGVPGGLEGIGGIEGLTPEQREQLQQMMQQQQGE